MGRPLELGDTMPFGKCRGRAICDLLRDDPGYLCWMRDIRKTDHGETRFFAADVLRMIDAAIGASKKLHMKHAIWDASVVAPAPLPAAPPANTEIRKAADAPVQMGAKPEVQEVAYKDMWGAY